jgi:hypothetical protein
MTDKITAICQECNKQFDYVLKPGFPRKYCHECSEIKKANFVGKVPVEKPGVPEEPEKTKSANGKHASMYTSYAKDIFCALTKQLEGQNIDGEVVMKIAINLVKQAKEAFE